MKEQIGMNRNEIFISSTMLSATELNLTLIVTKIRTNTSYIFTNSNLNRLYELVNIYHWTEKEYKALYNVLYDVLMSPDDVLDIDKFKTSKTDYRWLIKVNRQDNNFNTVVNLVLKWALDGGLTNDIE